MSAAKLSKQREFEKQRRIKRRIILIAIIIITIIAGVVTYLLKAPQFKIKEIQITGNIELTKEEIENLSEIEIGDNIFSILEIVEKVKLKQNNYVQDVKVKKIYPNKIQLEIVERQKQYQVRTETGCYIYIDEQGYILDYSLDKLEIPSIIGMELSETEINKIKRLQEKDLNKMENILQIVEECKKINIADKITHISLEEYKIILENEGITIELGDANNLKNKMYYVNAMMKTEAGNQGTIYVNGNLNEGFTPYFSAK